MINMNLDLVLVWFASEQVTHIAIPSTVNCATPAISLNSTRTHVIRCDISITSIAMGARAATVDTIVHEDVLDLN